ncbi:MAG: Crp/Fnr family transcriptional regulator [Rhodoferax sp.]|jgi:CRP-like cAMP-binding protein|nr:Crp/Fnr family transcriptional regulator [Rhodoferax sp.]MBP9929275.1 Crp/Fnr family transcriptional regulator [Rhodoferax sp.]HQX61551.1 Crp/Fnr family transcriptional regulator [Burkholderiaceae bacterium]HQZ06185.1 Crp/Fnr family transcriptional regulator [Burkholderiaceae bacterium]
MEDRVFDVPRYLSVLPLFNDLSAQELRHVADGSTLRRQARGDLVFRVGEPCNEFHVVVTGQVKLFVLSPSGQEKVVELISDGQSFAEAIMFTDRPYFLSAQALTDSLMLTVSKRAVIDEIARDHRFALRMLGGMSRRLHGLVHDVETYALHSGLQRVIGYLLRDHDIGECEPGDVRTVSLPVSKATIASRLSLTPEYFSRVLHELESRGLIEIDRRDIRIPDSRKLSNYQLEAA